MSSAPFLFYVDAESPPLGKGAAPPAPPPVRGSWVDAVPEEQWADLTAHPDLDAFDLRRLLADARSSPSAPDFFRRVADHVATTLQRLPALAQRELARECAGRVRELQDRLAAETFQGSFQEDQIRLLHNAYRQGRLGADDVARSTMALADTAPPGTAPSPGARDRVETLLRRIAGPRDAALLAALARARAAPRPVAGPVALLTYLPAAVGAVMAMLGAGPKDEVSTPRRLLANVGLMTVVATLNGLLNDLLTLPADVRIPPTDAVHGMLDGAWTATIEYVRSVIGGEEAIEALVALPAEGAELPEAAAFADYVTDLLAREHGVATSPVVRVAAADVAVALRTRDPEIVYTAGRAAAAAERLAARLPETARAIEARAAELAGVTDRRPEDVLREMADLACAWPELSPNVPGLRRLEILTHPEAAHILPADPALWTRLPEGRNTTTYARFLGEVVRDAAAVATGAREPDRVGEAVETALRAAVARSQAAEDDAPFAHLVMTSNAYSNHVARRIAAVIHGRHGETVRNTTALMGSLARMGAAETELVPEEWARAQAASYVRNCVEWYDAHRQDTFFVDAEAFADACGRKAATVIPAFLVDVEVAYNATVAVEGAGGAAAAPYARELAGRLGERLSALNQLESVVTGDGGGGDPAPGPGPVDYAAYVRQSSQNYRHAFVLGDRGVRPASSFHLMEPHWMFDFGWLFDWLHRLGTWVSVVRGLLRLLHTFRGAVARAVARVPLLRWLPRALRFNTLVSDPGDGLRSTVARGVGWAIARWDDPVFRHQEGLLHSTARAYRFLYDYLDLGLVFLGTGVMRLLLLSQADALPASVAGLFPDVLARTVAPQALWYTVLAYLRTMEVRKLALLYRTATADVNERAVAHALRTHNLHRPYGFDRRRLYDGDDDAAHAEATDLFYVLRRHRDYVGQYRLVHSAYLETVSAFLGRHPLLFASGDDLALLAARAPDLGTGRAEWDLAAAAPFKPNTGPPAAADAAAARAVALAHTGNGDRLLTDLLPSAPGDAAAVPSIVGHLRHDRTAPHRLPTAHDVERLFAVGKARGSSTRYLLQLLAHYHTAPDARLRDLYAVRHWDVEALARWTDRLVAGAGPSEIAAALEDRAALYAEQLAGAVNRLVRLVETNAFKNASDRPVEHAGARQVFGVFVTGLRGLVVDPLDAETTLGRVETAVRVLLRHAPLPHPDLLAEVLAAVARTRLACQCLRHAAAVPRAPDPRAVRQIIHVALGPVTYPELAGHYLLDYDRTQVRDAPGFDLLMRQLELDDLRERLQARHGHVYEEDVFPLVCKLTLLVNLDPLPEVPTLVDATFAPPARASAPAPAVRNAAWWTVAWERVRVWLANLARYVVGTSQTAAEALNTPRSADDVAVVLSAALDRLLDANVAEWRVLFASLARRALDETRSSYVRDVRAVTDAARAGAPDDLGGFYYRVAELCLVAAGHEKEVGAGDALLQRLPVYVDPGRDLRGQIQEAAGVLMTAFHDLLLLPGPVGERLSRL